MSERMRLRPGCKAEAGLEFRFDSTGSCALSRERQELLFPSAPHRRRPAGFADLMSALCYTLYKKVFPKQKEQAQVTGFKSAVMKANSDDTWSSFNG